MKPKTEVVGRRVGEELVLVDLETNRIFSLNATGARIWELLEAGLEPTAIHAALQAEFEVGEPLSAEIDRLLAALMDEELVEVE